MVQLIKPQEVKIETINGEVTVQIVLDLNIHLDSEGLKSLDSNVRIPNNRKNEKEEEPDTLIPDFSSEKVDFGKQI